MDFTRYFSSGSVPALLFCLALSACGGDNAVDGGTPQAGNPPAAAAGDGNTVSATASPGGAVSVRVGASQTMVLTFTSSDGVAAKDLTVTSGLTSLPAGWSGDSALTCATVSTGTSCQTSLRYAPTTITASSTMVISYTYVDSAGTAKAGSATITYEGTPAPEPTLAYIPNETGNTVTLCTINADKSLSACRDSGATSLDRPESVALYGNIAYIANLSSTITRCDIASDGTLSACRDSGAAGALDRPARLMVIGSQLHASNTGNNVILRCEIGADGSLGGDCQGTAAPPWVNVPIDFTLHKSKLYIANTATNAVALCTVTDTGILDVCKDAGATLLSSPEGIAISGTNAYIANYMGRTITQCSVGVDDMLTNCKDAGVTLTYASQTMTINGSTLYLVIGSANQLLQCAIVADGTLSGCVDSGATMLNGPRGMTLR